MGCALSVREATGDDHSAIALICLLTGDRGTDATGMFGDDRAIADVYATPYLHGPECVALVWDEGEGAVGYVLGTADTDAFQRWFVQQWWPSLPSRSQRTEADAWLLPSAVDPRRMLIPQLAEYPAHLHIDLLPSAQRKGAGRALIEAMTAELSSRGVPGIHLVAAKANAAAQAFYPRVGFTVIDEDAESVTFGRRL